VLVVQVTGERGLGEVGSQGAHSASP